MNKFRIMFFCVTMSAISGHALSVELANKLEPTVLTQGAFPEFASVGILVIGGVALAFARRGVKK